MTANQLVMDAGDDIIDVERALFPGDFGHEYDLKLEVAQLLRQCGPLPTVDGVDDLVGLFHDERFEALQSLLSVPRTAIRTPQPGHQGNELIEGAF